MKKKRTTKQYASKTGYATVEVPKSTYAAIQDHRRRTRLPNRFAMPLAWRVYEKAPPDLVEAARKELLAELPA